MPLLLPLPHTTTSMASGSEGQGPHPQHLRLGGHSSLSCTNEFDTTTMQQ